MPGALNSVAISCALAEPHAMLNTIRAKPAQTIRLAGATISLRPGEDTEFPSNAGNRTIIYDAGTGLTQTLRAARAAYENAGVAHWFVFVGPGASEGELGSVVEELRARRWPHVRYPVLAREPGACVPARTSLEVRRIGAGDAVAHRQEVDQIWEKPGAGEAFVNASTRPGYHLFLAFDGSRAVAMGMLIAAGDAGYLCSGGTNPAFRNLGAQSALIAARVGWARELGLATCVSETVSVWPTSENNLRRAGMEPVFEWIALEVGQMARATSPPA